MSQPQSSGGTGTPRLLIFGLGAVIIVLGLAGAYFRVVRAILPSGPAGQQISVPLLVWAPPILGPLTLSLAGLMGLSAAWLEDPPDSGTLVFPGGRPCAAHPHRPDRPVGCGRRALHSWSAALGAPALCRYGANRPGGPARSGGAAATA